MTQVGEPRGTFLIRAPQRHEPERRYVLDVVMGEWLGLDYALQPSTDGRWSIAAADASDGRRLTLPDLLLGLSDEDWLTARCLPARPLPRLPVPPGGRESVSGGSDATLPVLFGDGASGSAWAETPDGLALSVDVFGSAFFLLTRMEEMLITARDPQDRFQADSSIAHAEGFVERPLVDEYVDLLAAALSAVWPWYVRPSTEYRLRLTHDIDRPWTKLRDMPTWVAARSVLGDIVNRHEPLLAARRLRAIADGARGRFDRDPVSTFDFLMTVSERHGLRSTFYFMAGGTPGEHDFRYQPSDPGFASILRAIHERGHEIGLHASYGSYRSAQRIEGELAALVATCRAASVEQASWGVRQHYLRFANPATWRHQDRAGLAHDSTMGFAEQVGFRSGTCREHPLFDLEERRMLAVRERPLVVMDATLFGYLGLGVEEAARRARWVGQVCRRHGGDAVILYHNDSVVGSRRQGHYRELVEELSRP